MNSRKHFEGGYFYPQDQEFQQGSSGLPGNEAVIGVGTPNQQLRLGPQPVQVDNFSNPLATNWQLPDFSNQLIEGVPIYNNADQSPNLVPQVSHIKYAWATKNGNALNQFYQPNRTDYAPATGNGNISSNSNPLINPSADITATTEHQKLTLATNAGVFNNASVPNRPSMPSLQSFVDNWGQPVSVSSLLDILNQSMGSTIFSNNNSLQQNCLSTCAFQELNQHDYNLNQPPGMDYHTCNVDLDANALVTTDKSRRPKKFQLTMRTESTSGEQNYLQSIEGEALQNGCEVLQNAVDSSTAATTVPTKAIDLEKVGDHGIDLNKTPQQKLPKRKKHRPKVVIEGKPQRTTMATNKKSATSKDKSSGKRKYVRRKGLTEPDQNTDRKKKPSNSNAGRARRSCKRTLDLDLDLDLDKSIDGNPENRVQHPEMQQTNRYIDLNSITEYSGLCSRSEGLGKMEKTQISRQNGSEKVNKQASAHTYRAPSTYCHKHMWTENKFLQSEQMAASFPDTGRVLHAGNSNFTYKPGETKNNDFCQDNCGYRYNTTQQPDRVGSGQSEVTTLGGLQKSRYIMSETTPKEVIQSLIKPSAARGLSRGHNYAVEQTDHNQDVSQEAESCRDSCSASAASENSQKKRKIGNADQVDMPAIQNGNKKACYLTSQTIEPLLESCRYPQGLNGVNSHSENDSLCSQLPARTRFPRQPNLSLVQSYVERVAEMKKLAQDNNINTQIEADGCKLTPPTPAKTGRSAEGKNSKSMPKQSAKSKKVATFTFTSNVLNANEALQEQGSSSGYPNSIQKTKGVAEIHKQPHIDEVIRLFNSLDIRETSEKDQKALVPYGGSGAIIPLDTKTKTPRPKVNLDNETIRVWNLLMGIEGSSDRDRMDKGSESWWENERKVFRGRADSFIARMRLVQGDRHFSRWKGSVVDSVIGVFLTQNVSDHLSSSAFMSLAAQFPLKSRSSTVGPQNSAGILVEEPETSVPDPGEPASHGKASSKSPEASVAESRSFQDEIISSQDSFDSSVIQSTEAFRSHSYSNSETEDSTPGSAYHNNYESTSKDVLSMEKFTPFGDDYNCITRHSLSDRRSSDEHKKPVHIEHEQQTAFLSIGNSENLLDHSPAMHSENYQLNATDNGVLLEGIGEESLTSWPSTTLGISPAKDAVCTRRRIEHKESLNSCIIQTQCLPISREKPPREHNALTENHYLHQLSTSPPKFITANCQQCGINSHMESTTGMKQRNLTEVLDRGNGTIQHLHNIPKMSEDKFEAKESNLSAEKQKELENIVDASNSKDQLHNSVMASKGNNSTNRRKKGKAGGEIKPDEYWESLRKQVQANSTDKERRYDTMDSMDYEAIRHASVDYISRVIIKRGMNNMLAERIKEFLNRLVRVHGSIDLEWLKDVPPDEAKNYLLNIWGIGLKSVECVRLLTLHHMAFPVDVNVGRIAVRLGWVPLQPLPEALQIHLLELYPVLETVQKYLWPRLCKLDQKTLYELHYHLITFGKVFCTKHKPNCNACPMRGECRHFASAFASARLALPGLEEKSIVSSCPHIASEGDPSVVINTTLQLPPENSSFTRTYSGKSNCEPIIEEPKTPELESKEVLEYDIEDAFWEDYDEVPKVQLNMQELTANLQDYVQANNLELEESDVSKALIALTPEAAYIPAPKLKNVNRLRTEHQVYQIPDLHPLLEGMDRRETDDPSPYLLSIWTPGETADADQPPKTVCDARERGELCNEKTCFSCNNTRESESQTVRGTLLIPCRTAMRGRFPLNGTYFQVNEVFADDKSSKNPIAVPRKWLWNLPRRTVYFGTSVTSIFRGLSTEQIQLNFWRGFVCVRGFDRETRAPRPLVNRLHRSQTTSTRKKDEKMKEDRLNNKGNKEKRSSRSSSNKRT